MTKVLGGLCVLAAAAAFQFQRSREFRRRMALLEALTAALGEMDDAIRMDRTPMPRLLARLAAGGGPTGGFFAAAAASLARGGGLAGSWDRAARELDLPEEAREALSALGRQLAGDEAKARKGLAQTARVLERTLENCRRRQPDWEKRGTALALSAGALVVILLA